MKICFIVTNFNNSEFTEKLCKSLEGIEYEFSLVVVDNNSKHSDKNNLKKICSKFSFIKVIFNNRNLGYFSGLNTGISSVNSSDYDFIVIGNNDLEFSLNFFNSLKLLPEKIACKYPVIAPNIITIDGIHQNPHVIKEVSGFREFLYDLYFTNFLFARLLIFFRNLLGKIGERGDEDFHEIGQEIYQGYGACYILTPLFFNNFDKLWSPTFLMGEEFFLWKQLDDKDLKIWYEPSVKLNHADHASVSKLPKKDLWKISKESHKIYKYHLASVQKKRKSL